MLKKLSAIAFAGLLVFLTAACSGGVDAAAPSSDAPMQEEVAGETPQASEMEESAEATEEEAAPSEEASVEETPESEDMAEVGEESATLVAAADVDAAGLFQKNCAACHAKGTNRVMAQKTLKKDALEQYGMYDKGAIAYQITNGKNAMPRFGGRLSETEIDALADYVLAQADNGWS